MNDEGQRMLESGHSSSLPQPWSDGDPLGLCGTQRFPGSPGGCRQVAAREEGAAHPDVWFCTHMYGRQGA